MNARALLFAGLFATAAIAFSGVFAETTGIEFAEPAAASCTPPPQTGAPLPDGPFNCMEHYVCYPTYTLLGWGCIQ